MLKLKGKGVYGAIFCGKASLIQAEEKIRRVAVDNIEKELERVDKAKKEATGQLDKIYKKAISEVGETGAQIFEIHKMMIEDEDYCESIDSIIKNQGVNAEYAVSITSDNFASMFESMDSDYMRARASDVKDVSKRIIDCGDKANPVY